MRGSDPMRPMGHCIGIVYRSWAFLQRQVYMVHSETKGLDSCQVSRHRFYADLDAAVVRHKLHSDQRTES